MPAAPVRRMTGRPHFQFYAFLPEGIVVKWRIDGQGMGPAGMLGQFRRQFRDLRVRAAHIAIDHDRLHAQLADGEFQLIDAFFGRLHRDQGSRRHMGGKIGEFFRIHDVHGAADGGANFGVLYVAHAEAAGGIDDGEIDAALFLALGAQLRQHGHRPVLGVGA